MRESPGVLAKALRLLDLFTRARPEWRAADAARALDLPVSTAHRLMQELADTGYLIRTRHGYRLGIAAVRLGERALATYELRLGVRPALEELAAVTGETSVLATLSHTRDSITIMDYVESTQDVRVSLPIGRELPGENGAIAKVFRAFSPSGSLSVGFPGVGDEEITRIRAQGYSFSYEETVAGSWGVAAPVLDRQQSPVAALAVFAPTMRYSDGIVAAACRAVLAAASRVPS